MRDLMFGLLALGWGVQALASDLAAYTVPATTQAGVYRATGTVQAIRSANLAVPVSGRITRLPAQVNQTVRAGELLAQVDSAPADQNAQASRAQIAAAQASLAQAKNEWQRTQTLAAQHYLSTAALEKAQMQFQVAAAQAQAQMATAGAAGAQAAQYRITAPFTAVVARVDASLGAMAMPGQGLIEVYDPQALRIEVQLPASVFEQLRQDQTPTVALGGQSVHINQVQWFPTTEQYSQTRTVRLQLASGSTLTPGKTVSVHFASRALNRLQIPSRCVVRQSEFASVYVLAKDRPPQLRYIRVGQDDGERVDVLAGLKAGEQIALSPEVAAQRSQGGKP